MTGCKIRVLLLSGLVLLSEGAMAACSHATANAKAQEFAGIAKQKMKAHPDEMGDLAAEFGDAMGATAGNVTEQTCVTLDDLIKRATRL